MENQRQKCSSNKHSNIEAISLCQDCKKYLCNKCQNFHSEFFEDHNPINLDKNLEYIFSDICNTKNHNLKLEFYCKDHSALCCAACCTKIKNEIYGEHKDCDVCFISEIQDEKKKKLKENINILEDLSKNFEQTFNELKNIFEKINENKEELKLKIQKIFTKIRSALNEKEEKLLFEVDEQFNKNYFKENLVQKSEKLPNKIKMSLERGKNIDKEWNDKALSSMIQNCIDIEKNIQEINEINNKIKKNKFKSKNRNQIKS